MAISKSVGFACAAGACVALTGTAFAGGGNDPFDAEAISALPFAAAGDTSDNTDEFDVVCPFSGSTSPDAWYTYTTTAEQVLAISVCESAYDTKLYVLDSNFADIACVDDSCSDSNGNPFRSNLETSTLPAGTQVYIVVDGYLGDFGSYNLTVEGQEPPEPCVVECPDGGIAEGEDNGGECDETIDTNGGCNSSPFVISSVACGDTICGIAWADGGTRDTDWYSLPAQGALTQITMSMTGEFDGAYFYLGENPDCGSVAVITAVNPLACESSEIVEVATGETWWFAGAAGFEGFPCGVGAPVGNDYVISFSCTTDIPPAPCPTLGDSNSDGFVDFNDLLTVLANFGPCP